RTSAPLLTWAGSPPASLGAAVGRVERVRAAAPAVAKDEARPGWLPGLALDVAVSPPSPPPPDLPRNLLDPRPPRPLPGAGGPGRRPFARARAPRRLGPARAAAPPPPARGVRHHGPARRPARRRRRTGRCPRGRDRPGHPRRPPAAGRPCAPVPSRRRAPR